MKKRFIGISCMICMMALLVISCGKADAEQPESMETEVKTAEETEEKAAEEIEEIVENKMPSFTTMDLEGNVVTDDIFSQKDLTIVNVWGTYCGPCINEMPELGEWAKELPENVQLIGLVCDGYGNEDTAALIVEQTGADYLQLIANEDFLGLFETIVGVPTTYFVDKDGNIVGEPIIGAYVDGYKNFVEGYFNGQ